VQWDPERDLHPRPLPHRSLQVGLSGEAVRRCLDEWIVEILDVTETAHRIRDLVTAGDPAGARAHLPDERLYPLPPEVAVAAGTG